MSFPSPQSFYNYTTSGQGINDAIAANSAAAAQADKSNQGTQSVLPADVTTGVGTNGGAKTPGKSGIGGSSSIVANTPYTPPGRPTSMSASQLMGQIFGQFPVTQNGVAVNGSKGTGLSGLMGTGGNSTTKGTGLMGSVGNMFMGGNRVKSSSSSCSNT